MKPQRKVAIVTGSASGIGAATAVRLAELGYDVVVNYARSRAEAEAVAAACGAAGAEALCRRADVADDAACRRLVQATLAKWGRIDALVNSAGTTRYVDHADLDGLTPEDFQRAFAVNVTGVFQMVRAVAPHMKAAGDGAIVTVSSIAGIDGTGSSIAYAASKGAVNVMTRSLARVLAPEVRINAVCPGFVATRWQREGLGANYDKAVARIEATMPLRHACTAEDIAATVVMLIAGGRYVTGETLLVDSGLHLGVAPSRSR